MAQLRNGDIMIPTSANISPRWLEKIANGEELEVDSHVVDSVSENEIITIEAVNAIDAFETYNILNGLRIKVCGSTYRKVKSKEFVYVGEDSALFCVAFRAKMEWTK